MSARAIALAALCAGCATLPPADTPPTFLVEPAELAWPLGRTPWLSGHLTGVLTNTSQGLLAVIADEDGHVRVTDVVCDGVPLQPRIGMVASTALRSPPSRMTRLRPGARVRFALTLTPFIRGSRQQVYVEQYAPDKPGACTLRFVYRTDAPARWKVTSNEVVVRVSGRASP